jgi:hypothetical protein
MEADNGEPGKDAGQQSKEGGMAKSFHYWIAPAVELNGKSAFLTNRIKGQELVLQDALAKIWKDSFRTNHNGRKLITQRNQLLQALGGLTRIEPDQAVELPRSCGCRSRDHRDIFWPSY